MAEPIPAHHHPFDDCDGCRRAQEIIFDPSSKVYKKAYFQVIEEMVRHYEADPAVKEHRSQGTFKQHFADYMKANPELWDTYFVEAINAAYEKLENEQGAT